MKVQLHKEQLCKLCSSPNIIRVIKENETGGPCGTNGRDNKCSQNFSQKKERKRPRFNWSIP
jgi:hypothetical protein